MNYKDKLLRHYHILGYLSIKPRDWNAIRNRLIQKLDDSLGEYALRTFQRDIQSINEIFGVEIRYNFILQAYEIEDKSVLKQKVNSLSQLIMNLKETAKLDNIINDDFEGLGAVHLSDIMEAMNNNFYITFDYQKFNEESSSERKAIPIVLKEHNNRWYLLAEDMKKNKLRVFGLDRMNNINIKFTKISSRYTLSESLKIWNNTIGIDTGEFNQEPEIVRLRFDSEIAPYIKSLPWHKSQIIISENLSTMEIELKVLITNDLINKIMSCAQYVKVLAPLNLKETINSNLKRALNKNN